MEGQDKRELTIRTSFEGDSVVVRFIDTGLADLPSFVSTRHQPAGTNGSGPHALVGRVEGVVH